VKIAVEAQRAASQRRSTEPQSNVEVIHRCNLAEAASGQKEHPGLSQKCPILYK
jgi:hypothetical protein